MFSLTKWLHNYRIGGTYRGINGSLLRDAVISAAVTINNRKREVDELNVYPVPDGDTGTNMSLTMQSATREINSKEYLRADEAANALAKGALKGARGNSGVITSQILRGLCEGYDGAEEFNTDSIGLAFRRSLKARRTSVILPCSEAGHS